MRAPDASAALTPEQQRMADTGLKAMIPLNGRPFLDYILSSLADAGIPDIALIVGPDHDALRRYYESEAPPMRVRLGFVVQEQPLGTANAVLAAERWVEAEPFLALNADNLYPISALTELAALSSPGLAAFDAEDLIRSSNIPPERIPAFAFLEADDQGYLTGILEKPDRTWLPPSAGRIMESGRASRPKHLVSMNCWRFDERILSSCRDVARSARGEFEIPDAVGLAMRRGVAFKIFEARGPVLDLSTRADAADVARRLTGTSPKP
jgi:glucose-1-phosphate thymidylyltransferase